jgi:hypothetical protein
VGDVGLGIIRGSHARGTAFHRKLERLNEIAQNSSGNAVTARKTGVRSRTLGASPSVYRSFSSSDVVRTVWIKGVLIHFQSLRADYPVIHASKSLHLPLHSGSVALYKNRRYVMLAFTRAFALPTRPLLRHRCHPPQTQHHTLHTRPIDRPWRSY